MTTLSPKVHFFSPQKASIYFGGFTEHVQIDKEPMLARRTGRCDQFKLNS